MAKRRIPSVPISAESGRRPYHETIVITLEEATKDMNPLVSGGIVLALTKQLNRTVIPQEHLRTVANQLRTIAENYPLRPPLLDAANRLEAEYRRLIE